MLDFEYEKANKPFVKRKGIPRGMKISISNYNKLIPKTFHSFSKLRKKRRTTKFRDKVSKQETGGAIKRFLPPRCPHGSFPLPRLRGGTRRTGWNRPGPVHRIVAFQSQLLRAPPPRCSPAVAAAGGGRGPRISCWRRPPSPFRGGRVESVLRSVSCTSINGVQRH